MEVILQQDVDSLGHIGEIVKVKRGYARNYLLPRGLAVLADRRNRAELDHWQRSIEAKKKKVEAVAKERVVKLSQLSVEVTAKASEEGRLFGSVTNQDIAKLLTDQGFEIDRRKIQLEGPLKALGEHIVPISLGAGVKGTVKVTVVREEESEAADVPAEPVSQPAAHLSEAE